MASFDYNYQTLSLFFFLRQSGQMLFKLHWEFKIEVNKEKTKGIVVVNIQICYWCVEWTLS